MMDYRVKLFQSLNDKYEIRFFWRESSPIHHNLKSIYASDVGRLRLRGSALTLLGIRDFRKLCGGIRWSNVFITSFGWNTYTLAGLLLCRLFNRRIIVWEEINVVFPGLRFRIMAIILRILYRHCDALYLMGEVQENTLIRFGVAPEKMFVANEYPGYIYSNVDAREIMLPFDREFRIIMYMGRLVEFKGVEYLIRAFQSIERERDDVALVVVGYGPLRQHLEDLSNALGLKRIHFAGDVADIHSRAYLLQRCSIVVVPSIVTKTMHEGGPIVVLEGLSAGKPVIGTDALGSSTRFIEDGVNGFIVPQKSVNALAQKIKWLLDHPISTAQVLATFRKIKGHETQVEQMQMAIRYALRLRNQNILRESGKLGDQS
jgi:glycosyltransferase involved in cell wall biosynthesis